MVKVEPWEAKLTETNIHMKKALVATRGTSSKDS
jgi:hypothetical protein